MIKVLFSFLVVAILGVVSIFWQPQSYSYYNLPYPTDQKLNIAIAKAEKYYEGLYRPMPNNMAVMAEYYSGNKSVYTVRHGVIGGYYYYTFLHNQTKATALKNLITKYGFIPSYDDHSFIWTTSNTAPLGIVYDIKDYHDCAVTLPFSKTVFPYHSKVCKLGMNGIKIYLFLSRFDPLSPIETAIQSQEQGRKITTKNFEQLFDRLGYGVPICTFLGCGNVASTIRTAQFGLLELRQGHNHYADMVAASLLQAQTSDGAIYISYNRNGQFANEQSGLYKLLNLVISDKAIYKGFIPTNAETMNDSLAFLLQYKQMRHNTCIAISYEK